MAEPIHIKDALADFFLKCYGKPCNNAMIDDCQNDCTEDKGFQCWKRVLSEDKKDEQNNP